MCAILSIFVLFAPLVCEIHNVIEKMKGLGWKKLEGGLGRWVISCYCYFI